MFPFNSVGEIKILQELEKLRRQSLKKICKRDFRSRSLGTIPEKQQRQLIELGVRLGTTLILQYLKNLPCNRLRVTERPECVPCLPIPVYKYPKRTHPYAYQRQYLSP